MGCAVGTICASAYANIFMAQFEAKHIHPYIHGKALLLIKFIDDIFTIRNATIDEIILFIDELNKKHKTIKFDYKISIRQTEFLDTTLHRDQQHKIQTKLFKRFKTQRFKERGYPENLVKKQVDKAKNMKRKQLLSTNKRTVQNRIPVSIT